MSSFWAWLWNLHLKLHVFFFSASSFFFSFFSPAGLEDMEVKAGAEVVVGAEVTQTEETTETEAIISRGHMVTMTTGTKIIIVRTVGVVVTTTMTEGRDSTETAHRSGETDTRSKLNLKGLHGSCCTVCEDVLVEICV